MSNAPILLFAYKRPEHTRRLLESLANNAEAAESELHIFIDGPKHADEKKEIEKVSVIAKSKLWCRKVSVYKNTQNQGVPQQVIGAVSKFCQKEGRAIILEDDLILSPYFLNHMNTTLKRYANEKKVMEVTGYIYPVEHLNVECGFMRGSCGWGWGTWERAWKLFEPDGKKLLARLSDRKMRYEFNFRNSYKYFSILQDQVKGKVGGWDIRWFASIFLNQGFTLYPSVSLVRNTGFDGTGTNARKSNQYETPLLDHPISNFPAAIEESEEILAAIIKYYRQKHNLGAKIVDAIRNMV